MKGRGAVRGVCAVLGAFLCGAFCYALARMPAFGGTGYEFSCGASSSARIVRTDAPVFYKLTHPVAGESARFQGDVSEELLLAYRAGVVIRLQVPIVAERHVILRAGPGGGEQQHRCQYVKTSSHDNITQAPRFLLHDKIRIKS